MKTISFPKIFGFLIIFSLVVLYLNGEKIDTSSPIKVDAKLKKEFPIQEFHEKLSLDCSFCHEGQGNNPREFSAPDEKVCLACHKSKEYLAKRLEFMDALKVNPHNSIHDGPTLYCDECHRSHTKSVNMCAECHEKEIKEDLWMRKTP
ncbi:MAG: cytochrome c3 family protein [Arcobacter sp.]|nr:cytochrome c3 family protein [Arcobacter sp.]